MSNYTLKIDGVARNLVDDRVRLESLTISYDEPRKLILRQHGRPHFSPTYDDGAAVELFVDSNCWFRGVIEDRELIGKPGAEEIVYTCLGLRQSANRIKVRHPSLGIEARIFNMPREDEHFAEVDANLSLGQMLKNIFDENLSALREQAAAPAGGAAYVESELEDLAVVPTETVVLVNQGFTDAVDELMRWQPGHVWHIDPETQVWHFQAIESLPSLTLTLVDDNDRVLEDLIEESTRDSFTAYVIHGRRKQVTKFFLLSQGQLTKGWPAELESTWTIGKGLQVEKEEGGIPTDSTPTGFTDDDADWATGEWEGGVAWMKSIATLNPLFEPTMTTNVVGNTRTHIRLDQPHYLAIIGRYRLWTGESPFWDVWRKFQITTPGDRQLARRLHAGIRIPVGNGLYEKVFQPVCLVRYRVKDSTGVARNIYVPVAVEVDYEHGIFRTAVPVVQFTSSPDDLKTPGQAQGPSDVILIADVLGSTLTVRLPASGYDGTAFSKFGIERIRYEYVDRWRDPAQQPLVEVLGSERLKSLQDVRYHGAVPLAQRLDTVRNLGYRVNLRTRINFETGSGAASGTGLRTGLEDMNALVRRVTYRWNGRRGLPVETDLSFDSAQPLPPKQEELALSGEPEALTIEDLEVVATS